jgi:hypothetical protein
MSKGTLVFLVGIIITLTPFLGIPEIWRQYAIAGLGALLILIGYMQRRELYLKRIDYGNGERGTDSFIESTEPLFKASDVK